MRGLNNHLEYFRQITGNRTILANDSVDSDGNLLAELYDQDKYIEEITPSINILNNIRSVYSILAYIIEVLGLVSYVILLCLTTYSLLHKKYHTLDDFVLTSALLGSVFVLIAGVSYIDYAITRALTNLYLVGAYPLFIAFSLLSIYSIVDVLLSKRINSKNVHNEN